MSKRAFDKITAGLNEAMQWKMTAAPMSPETLAFIAHELSKPRPAGTKRRVWLKTSSDGVIVESSL